ncbi:MAG: transporter cpa2 [Prolixibacteraceae bacterium]|nr:MAG: transporter cpa2 [Prolixibacteraceae bacterium]
MVIIPKHAEIEIGFSEWLAKVWNIGRNTGAKMIFYASPKTTGIIKEIHSRHPIDAEFRVFDDWEDFLIVSRLIKQDDGLIIVMSREKKPSYQTKMKSIPEYLNSYFVSNSFILIYPMQTGVLEENIDLTNASLIEPMEKIDEIGKIIARLFRRK